MKILLVDDAKVSREIIADFIVDATEHSVIQCNDALEAIKIFVGHQFDLVISDLKMPGMNGLQLIKKLKQLPNGDSCDYVIITGYGELSDSIEAFKMGVFDFLIKPVGVEDIYDLLGKIEKSRQQKGESIIEFSSDEGDQGASLKKIIVMDPVMKRIYQRAMSFHMDRAVPVLIEGETGTGKEVIANLIHMGEKGNRQPFICLNCSAISSSLFESELFGYEAGAFTGANKSGMKGKLELAQGGTIFLDEIGDMPLDMQPKLLRVLQEKELYRIGGTKKVKLDVRIICATNKKLIDQVNDGLFRKDLFYRLNVGNIYLPPLRERKEEIPGLAQAFLTEISDAKKRKFSFVDNQTLHLLNEYDWPGNVRELRHVIERAVVYHDDVVLKPEHINFSSFEEREPQVSSVLSPYDFELPDDHLDFDTLEKVILQKTLDKFGGNQSKAASYLGLSRSVFRTKVSKLDK